ncbi:MAG: HypC/HybG/HupF family hydrogenase formation chaperone [Euryarchaeota archaeon]|nr:HypC/HybG/HupF family hydrogenase formation chaperone [Euryarchaeota archaeon]
MCLGIPALVKERTGDIGRVDFGGTSREVNLSLVDARVGDYVIVHAGFAIQVMEERQALETLKLFREVYGEQVGLPAAGDARTGGGKGGGRRAGGRVRGAAGRAPREKGDRHA